MDYDLTSSYDYDLPPELIADVPASVRSQSRLMVGRIEQRRITHHTFSELPEILAPGDLLVFNDVRVVAARVHTRKSTGGAVELFVIDVLSPTGADRWTTDADEVRLRCMTRSSKRLRAGQTLHAGTQVFTIEEAGSGFAVITTATGGRSTSALLDDVGEIPLPPYIVRRRAETGAATIQPQDSTRYQTVYADRAGAVAAPTAGLHFDLPLLDVLDQKGIKHARLSLDVGPGTFRPVSTERLSEHEMHTETYTVSAELGAAITATKAAGGRVVAVGTTAVRALESEALLPDAFGQHGPRGTDLFIAPGFEFRVVDAMITNFHLPRSTLLALVYAFGDAELVKRMYDEAVKDRYRFYSYGDAMLLLRDA